MRANKVEICGIDTSELKTLKEEEKRSLLYITQNATGEKRKEARDKLVIGNLRLVLSVVSRFTPKRETQDDLFIFYVTGYGHGVGLSQYGANQMALEGADYREILTHYYSGVEIQNIGT